MNQKIILVDPVFSDYAFSIDFFVKRFQPAVLKLEELPPIDYVIISHNHYDHLDKKTVSFFKDKKKTQFLLPKGVGEDVQSWGIEAIRIRELDWYESVKDEGISFTAAPAQHFSGRGLFDRNKTLWASWVIETAGSKVFYSGDTGYSSHFKEIGEKLGPFDLAFMENGQYNERWADIHLMPANTIQAFLDINAKYFVPVHWGMFDLAPHKWYEPVEETYSIGLQKSVQYITPKLGETKSLNDAHIAVADPWWRLFK